MVLQVPDCSICATSLIHDTALRLAPGNLEKKMYGKICPEAQAPETVPCVIPHLQIATALQDRAK